MYLSLLRFDYRSFQVLRDVRDVVRLHQLVMGAFPAILEPEVEARAYYGVLHRLEIDTRRGDLALYVQSAIEPDWSGLAGYLLPGTAALPNPGVRSVAEAYAGIREGRTLRFRLQANPTRKVETKSGPDGERRNGRRVPLGSPEQQMDWLARKAEKSGFVLLEARLAGDGRVPGRGYRSGREVTLQPVLFEGRLRVTDVGRFVGALRQGIGPGKAWGCGLLSVGPG